MLDWSRRMKSIVTHPFFPILIICFAALTLRLYRLSTPTQWYFDEVYHGYTAVEYAKGNKAAYDPWANSPPGVAFEWVHPPLAKLIMSWSVMVFGPTSWAWRLPSAFFGTAVVGLTGILAWLWTKDQRVAWLASLFLALDGLNLVMSRVAMNDVFFLTFILLALISYTLAWEKTYNPRWITLSAVALGAALASKWTTLYITPVIAADLLWRWQRSRKAYWPPIWHAGVLFVILPPLLYLLSYSQYFAWGYSWENFVMLQKQIWWYHTGLEATHPYQSTPLQWILNLRPVWFYSSSTAFVSQNIYALGNPFFFWSGIVAVFYQIHSLIKQQKSNKPSDWGQVQMVMCYFALWVPWTFSPRIMFFYHYLPALPFLAIMLAKTLTQLERKDPRNYVVINIGLIGLMALWFLLFFPHLTALPVTAFWHKELFYFIPTWR